MIKYIIISIILMTFLFIFLYMKKNNLSILSAETIIDNNIDSVLKLLNIIWSHGKYAIIIISIIAIILAWKPYLKPKAVDPIRDAINDGIKAKNLAMAISIGTIAGFGPPGLTMQFQLLMFFIIHQIGIDVGLAEFAVATAINFALSIPDLIVWKVLFMRLGSLIIPAGGRYVRPFIAGLIPYTAISIPSLAILYQILFQSFKILGMKE
jgi:hypothetical protein